MRDDLFFDPVVGRLRDDVFANQVVLRPIGPSRNDLLRIGIANSRQCLQLVSCSRVDIELGRG